MSASSKKKLRREQEAAKMTEKQLAALKEAKKTNLYTTVFVVAMVAILVIAITVGVTQFITNSGIREKNTTALTIGQHELSNAELNYYYIDSINSFYSQNSSYASLFGLDVSAPLNEQVFDESTGETWADYFVDAAISTATAVYAMNDAAKAEGFTLPAEEAANLDTIMSNFELYGMMYGFSDAEGYIKAMYGKGATAESLRNYMEMSLIAEAYNAAHEESLVYEDADLRAAEAENPSLYDSFSYNYYYLAASRFQEGGTTAEDGSVTYSAEEEAAALAAAEEAAKSLAESAVTLEELDAAIDALPVNSETTAKTTNYSDYAYADIDTDLAAWLAEDGRQEGDIAYVANTSGEEVLGYYVVYFLEKNDNNVAMKNVRHILVTPEGGTTDANGATVYSDEEKAAAKAEAEKILADWQAGEATEDSFGALAMEISDDTGSTEVGGLYEDIYPGQMVSAFEDWCFDASRATGDTGIVETEYGFHIMYFVGSSEMTYRDHMIREALMEADQSEWYNGIVGAVDYTEGNTKYLTRDMVLAANG